MMYVVRCILWCKWVIATVFILMLIVYYNTLLRNGREYITEEASFDFLLIC